jgi:hypothetical protein
MAFYIMHLILIELISLNMFINQNHRKLCYYAMNNHMYSVKNPDLVKSMVEKAKAPEHKIKTTLFEYDIVKIIINMRMIITILSI